MKMNHDEYWKQGSDRLDAFERVVSNLIETFPQKRRDAVREMMDGPVGEQFMLAPASTRRSYHNAFPCGLVAHSLNVVDNATKLANTLAPGRWPTATIIFCALFHDLGKAGSSGKPYYIPTKDDWKMRRGEYWEVSKDDFMPNSEKSLFILQEAGIVLSHEETVAIRWNDGPGSPGNQAYSFHEPDLALIIHWADFWSMRQEKSADS